MALMHSPHVNLRRTGKVWIVLFETWTKLIMGILQAVGEI